MVESSVATAVLPAEPVTWAGPGKQGAWGYGAAPGFLILGPVAARAAGIPAAAAPTMSTYEAEMKGWLHRGYSALRAFDELLDSLPDEV